MHMQKREQGANAVNGGNRVLSASIAFTMLIAGFRQALEIMEYLENH